MKIVSEKLKKLLNSKEVQDITNRSVSTDYEAYLKKIIPNLLDRKPTIICDEDGNYIGTTLDFQSMMYHLNKEGVVINLPKYNAMRGTVLKEGQNLVSKENRHGKVVGLSCSKNLWTFGFRIIDANVAMRTESGDFRVFNVVNINGEWYQGWERIEFMPDAEENKFLEKLSSDNKVTFQDFISKQRRFNLYSFQYFMMKILMIRLEDEIQYLGGLIKLMYSKGITLPEEDKKVWPEQTRLGNEKKITVKSVTFEVDIPPLTGEYPMIELNLDTLKETIKRKKYLTYGVKSRVQFYLRGEEYANFKFASEEKPFPHWMQGLTWEDYKSPPKLTVNPNFIKKFSGNDKIILNLMKERVYKENEKNQFFSEFEALNKLIFGVSEVPEIIREKAKFTKGRVVYKRLLIFQPDIGMYGVSLLKKEFEKVEVVNENFEE